MHLVLRNPSPYSYLSQQMLNPENELRRLEMQFPADDWAVSALTYYRAMRAALNEDQFRWTEWTGDVSPSKIRSYRLQQYARNRELFEIEVKAAWDRRMSLMGEERDWSQVKSHLVSGLCVRRSYLMLRLASCLYRAHIPGAADICDSAASYLFRAAYA